jgi:hypothetical protein
VLRKRPGRTSVRCCPANIRQVGACCHLERVLALVHLRCTFLSRLPDPDRLAVPIRPVVVGAASHPSLRFQGQAAPYFTGLPPQARGGFLHSTRLIAPRGALVLVATVEGPPRSPPDLWRTRTCKLCSATTPDNHREHFIGRRWPPGHGDSCDLYTPFLSSPGRASLARRVEIILRSARPAVGGRTRRDLR